MLLRLAYTHDDKQFRTMLGSICAAYWPHDEFCKHSKQLPSWGGNGTSPNATPGQKSVHEKEADSSAPPDATERLKRIHEKEKEITTLISNEAGLYMVYGADGEASGPAVGMPFVERFHLFFLQRQWEYPYHDPQKDYENLFRLLEPTPEEASKIEKASRSYVNYSRNIGDYHHFINVIAATARFIEFFKNPANVFEAVTGRASSEESDGVNTSFDHLSLTLGYPAEPTKRVFKLLLAAFYHDMGKTIDYHRHGMEGANIITNHTSLAVLRLRTIAERYSVNADWDFERDDLLFVALLVYYHDQFGMLGTGEAGYLRMSELVNRMWRHSLNESELEERSRIGRHLLFDLWVLNLADIMVSLDGIKNKPQYSLTEDIISGKDAKYFAATLPHVRLDDREVAFNRIKSFIHEDKFKHLRHDFHVALTLLDTQNKSHHSEDLIRLEQHALDYAKRHVAERIRRLLRALLVDHRSEYLKHIDEAADIKQTFVNITGRDEKHWNAEPARELLDEIAKFSESNWNSIISRCIYAASDYVEFTKRFSWIGQMDYAYGFFSKIAQRALLLVNLELLVLKHETQSPQADTNAKYVNWFSSGWVYRSHRLESTASTEGDDKYSAPRNAEFFADNYTSTLVQIIEHLLFREKEVDRIRNLEFWIANERLTDEKIDRIIALEGPFRTRQSVQLALESIFIW